MVLADQLAGGLDRLLRVVDVVHDAVVDLATVDTTGGVDLVEGGLGACGDLRAGGRDRAAQRGPGSDLDIAGLRVGISRGRPAGRDGQGGNGRTCDLDDQSAHDRTPKME